MEIEQAAKDLANYYLLKFKITATLNAYNGLLNDYEHDLKEYVKQDLPQPLINVQQTLIIKLKAKIEVLTDLN